MTLYAKRDDMTADLLGGNKVRALELLLARLGPDDVILTIGSEGSSHALSVARYGARLGAQVEIVTWPQPMHEVAHATAARIREFATVFAATSPVEAYLRAMLRRLRPARRWIPAG
ncbi:MAG: hypothetical protein H0W68_11090, partial [Gemmatimonadaceae bacterium]|nr:hypothetical protein [Gemmatimonadaceae bacterium]